MKPLIRLVIAQKDLDKELQSVAPGKTGRRAL